MSQRTAILLLAHGSPETAEDVPEFLRNITGKRPMPEAVVKEVQRRYALIGQSPLTCWTMEQAEGAARDSGLPVYVGMRNWRPYIRDTVKQMAVDGVTHAVAICLAPHNSRTSVGLYKQALLAENGQTPFTIDFVENWHDHPLLTRAFAERLREGWQKACAEAGAALPVIFTAHSVPERTIADGDPYGQQARHTAELVVQQVPEIKDWRFAFQSQGMSGGVWLGPTVEDTILAIKSEGNQGVFIQPIGFVCDHVEVLYDIDIAFRKFADDHGMRLWRAESLNGSKTFARAVAQVARERLDVGEDRAAGKSKPPAHQV
ncbi:MAG TPA: ferrochelatase [Clostridia bacterium]|nr:ferrochelatase [Clostridia bacterium]